MPERADGEAFAIRRVVRFETKRPRCHWKDYIVVLSVGGRDLEVRCTTPAFIEWTKFRRLVLDRHGVLLRDPGGVEGWRAVLNATNDRLGIHFGSIDRPEAPWERTKGEHV